MKKETQLLSSQDAEAVYIHMTYIFAAIGDLAPPSLLITLAFVSLNELGL